MVERLVQLEGIATTWSCSGEQSVREYIQLAIVTFRSRRLTKNNGLLPKVVQQ